jgi:hypothetical protein
MCRFAALFAMNVYKRSGVYAHSMSSAIMDVDDVLAAFRAYVITDLQLPCPSPMPEEKLLSYMSQWYTLYTFEFSQFPGIKLTGSDVCSHIEMHGYVHGNKDTPLQPCIRFLDADGRELAQVIGSDAVGLRHHLLYFISRADGVAHDVDLETVYDAFRSYLENKLKLKAQRPSPIRVRDCSQRIPVDEYKFEFKAFPGVGMTNGHAWTHILMNGSDLQRPLRVCIFFYCDYDIIGALRVFTLPEMYTQLDGLITKSSSPAVAALSAFDLKSNNDVYFVFTWFLEKELGLPGPWPHGTLNTVTPENSLAAYAYTEQTFEFNQWHGFRMLSNRRCARIKMRGLAIGEDIGTDDAGPSVGFYSEAGVEFEVACGHKSDELYRELNRLLVRDDSVEASPASSSVVVAPQKGWATIVDRVEDAVDGLQLAPGDADTAASNELVVQIMRLCVQLLKLKAGGRGK